LLSRDHSESSSPVSEAARENTSFAFFCTFLFDERVIFYSSAFQGNGGKESGVYPHQKLISYTPRWLLCETNDENEEYKQPTYLEKTQLAATSSSFFLFHACLLGRLGGGMYDGCMYVDVGILGRGNEKLFNC